MTERYEIRETKEYSFEVFDHRDRGKKIATFLYFKDAASFCGTPHAELARTAVAATPSGPSHIMCIGWPTIARLMTGEAIWFDDLQCGAIAASDLLASPGKGVSREDIATIIREGFESPPDDWPETKPWADGALDIADEIMGIFSIPTTLVLRPGPNPPAAALPTSSAIKCGARAIAASQGHDPDDLAPLTTMCTSDNQRVAWWKVFEEEAEACLGTIKAVLREHWLTGIVCDHEAKTDRATCSCSVWRCEPLPSVGAAVDAWINHVLCSVSRPMRGGT